MSGIAADQNTMNVLGEIFNLGGILAQGNPISSVFSYFGSALTGIHQGLRQFALEDSISNLKKIAIYCEYYGGAESRDLTRLQREIRILN